MMIQLGNDSRLKRSEINISTAATKDSVLNFHGYKEQGQVFRETLSCSGERHETQPLASLRRKGLYICR